MRTFACLAFAAFLPLSAHAAPARTWSTSGAELLQILRGQLRDGSAMPESGTAQARQRAQAYVMGIADGLAAQGTCDATGVLPHEQAARVFEALNALPADRLQGPAAPLVAAALAC